MEPYKRKQLTIWHVLNPKYRDTFPLELQHKIPFDALPADNKGFEIGETVIHDMNPSHGEYYLDCLVETLTIESKAFRTPVGSGEAAVVARDEEGNLIYAFVNCLRMKSCQL